MKKSLPILLLASAMLAGGASPASADVTFFLGLNPKPAVHSVRGVSAGISMLIVGFEFDYGVTREDVAREIPGLQTGMFNLLVQTPTNTSLYVTGGVGLYRESLAGDRVTNIGTNIGGGIKIGLFGPIKARIDYRIFTFRGSPRYPRPQRLYVGINWMF